MDFQDSLNVCREKTLSEDTYDFITDFPLDGFESVLGESFCYANVENKYNILYLDPEAIDRLNIDSFQYQSIPKLYGLMRSGQGNAADSGFGPSASFSPEALNAAGILQVQNPPLNLKGRGCVLCLIDTGIDYTMDVFKDPDGGTRILSIWDQTVQSGTPPNGFFYGSEYTRDSIQQALAAADPYSIVPSRDENGHGSMMAALAAGSIVRGDNRYTGAAPESDIVVIKLKPCKQYLREYHLVPEGVPAYQEDDIMLAVQYGNSFAEVMRRPVIFCIGLGTSMGDHNGSSALSRYLNDVAVRRSRAVVVCGGNEGNAAHHYRGRLTQSGNSEEEGRVEVRVAENCSGFLLECVSSLPDAIQVGLRSPGGETIPPIRIRDRTSITYRLIYSNTTITLDLDLAEASSGEQLLRFAVRDPSPGIWTFQVSSAENIYNGVFDMWLPVSGFLDAPVYFLRPDPYITMTEPAMASELISVTAYDASNNSFFVDSGRGFSRGGAVQPDLCAPGVNVPTIYGRQTGTDVSAAVTAGAVAQLFEWAVVQQKDLYAKTRELKSYLIRGASRSYDMTYPNREWGYGKLNLEGVFRALIGR